MKIALALMAVAACHAGTITSLYNTGADANAGIDLHWTVNGAAASVTNNAGFPSWPANTATSSWISPQPDYAGDQTDRPGLYAYSTQFDLSGYDASTASITAQFAADDATLAVLLNGNLMGAYLPVGGFVFEPPVTLASHFVAGINSLSFVVYNIRLQTHNPTGFRVEFASSADPLLPPPAAPPQQEAPEPASVALIGGGLLALGLWRRR